MRYTYGIEDERKILMYKPQMFLKNRDILIFSSSEFINWHNNIKEYNDALYQIDSLEMKKENSINMNELNLAGSIVNNIKLELEHIFDSNQIPNSSYHYLSTLDKKYKRRRSSYTSDMRRCDIIIPVITPAIKYNHFMEIVFEANKEFSNAKQKQKQNNEKKEN